MAFNLDNSAQKMFKNIETAPARIANKAAVTVVNKAKSGNIPYFTGDTQYASNSSVTHKGKSQSNVLFESTTEYAGEIYNEPEAKRKTGVPHWWQVSLEEEEKNLLEDFTNGTS